MLLIIIPYRYQIPKKHLIFYCSVVIHEANKNVTSCETVLNLTIPNYKEKSSKPDIELDNKNKQCYNPSSQTRRKQGKNKLTNCNSLFCVISLKSPYNYPQKRGIIFGLVCLIDKLIKGASVVCWSAYIN